MNENLYMGEIGLAELWNLMTVYVDGRLFVGTRAEYEAAAASIPEGAIVIITDESDVVLPPAVEEPDVVLPPAVEEPEMESTIAVLGIAKLGQMILGKR